MSRVVATVIIIVLLACENTTTYSQSTSLNEWLAKPVAVREELSTLEFATRPLTKAEVDNASQLLYKDFTNQFSQAHELEWNTKKLQMGTLEMPFFYKVFGAKPADGRSLFISLHGGGGAPADVNDQQYRNQQRLYDKTMQTLEGVYLAPRAPTNTWDLWHQEHIDGFLQRLIILSTIHLDVNPNKVYLLGYSAGGDGVYQLAPRMADRWAAASMMAGHPNDASPVSLRNTPFAIHMGAEDAAYDRNLKAQEWDGLLSILQQNDSDAYEHEVTIHEGKGHWMELQDAVALPWMSQFARNPFPEKVVWRQDDVHRNQFYWLGVPKEQIENQGEVVAEYSIENNEINIVENYTQELLLYLDDTMLDLDKPVTVRYKGEIIGTKEVERTLLHIYQNLEMNGDENYSFSAAITVLDNSQIK